MQLLASPLLCMYRGQKNFLYLIKYTKQMEEALIVFPVNPSEVMKGRLKMEALKGNL